MAPRTLVAAWEIVKARAADVFRPGVASTLSGLPGWPALGLPANGLDSEPAITLLDALRAFALRERGQASAREATVELVVTLPTVDRTVLSTPDVVRTLLEGARSSILVVGFEINDPVFRKVLFRRGLEGVDVTVVGDRITGAARNLLKDWPSAACPLRALENVEPAMLVPARLHGKVIVVDGSVALIGSANFTAGGLRNNIELGVRATGTVVQDILRTVERLENEGWLQHAQP